MSIFTTPVGNIDLGDTITRTLNNGIIIISASNHLGIVFGLGNQIHIEARTAGRAFLEAWDPSTSSILREDFDIVPTVMCNTNWQELTQAFIDSNSNGIAPRSYNTITRYIGRQFYIDPANPNEIHVHTSSANGLDEIAVYSMRFSNTLSFVSINWRIVSEAVPYCEAIQGRF